MLIIRSALSPFCYDVFGVFIDGVFGYDAADTRDRIDIGMPPDDRTGIENGVAADFGMIAKDGAEFFPSGLYAFIAESNGYKGLVTLDIGCYGACAHVGFVAEDGIAHIVVVRRLYIIKKDNVFKLNRVAHYAVPSDESIAADERTVPDFGSVVDDAGAENACTVKDDGVFCDPYVSLWMVKFIFGQGSSDLENGLSYERKRFPRVNGGAEKLVCSGLGKV